MPLTTDLAPFVIADLHRQADAGRRARDARATKSQPTRFETFGVSDIPPLRGWPWEPVGARPRGQ